MINRNEFQELAKEFRAGKLSLSDFIDEVYATASADKRRLVVEGGGNGDDELRFQLPQRATDAHKGDCGRVLLIGGSAQMPGAISLSASAALRTGSGLVAIMTPIEAWPIVAGYDRCVMTAAVDSVAGMFAESSVEAVLEKCEWADVVAIGPGMGRSVGCQVVVKAIYAQANCPVIVDADGLNNLSDAGVDLADHSGPRIVTPHQGEFLRLVKTESLLREELESEAKRLAQRCDITVLLKDQRTFVTDGTRQYHNGSGNAALATAGTGDVLTGVIASLVGQRKGAFEAASLGSYLHGRAADLYIRDKHPATLVATDLIDILPAAMLSLGANS